MSDPLVLSRDLVRDVRRSARHWRMRAKSKKGKPEHRERARRLAYLAKRMGRLLRDQGGS